MKFLTVCIAFCLLVVSLEACTDMFYVSDMYHYQSGQLIGYVNFTQQSSGYPVTISIHLEKVLSPGEHGMHVHEFGSIRNNCTASGGHFNPFKQEHGAPTDADRHVGDLGNINIDYTTNDVFEHVFTDNVISLCPGNTSIVGRTLAIHRDRDDLGRGGNQASKINGNAGPRIVCGVIGIGQP